LLTSPNLYYIASTAEPRNLRFSLEFSNFVNLKAISAILRRVSKILRLIVTLRAAKGLKDSSFHSE